VPTQYDLAVRVRDGSGPLRKARKLGGILLHARPLHLRVPGGGVALLQGRDSSVGLIFRCKRLEQGDRFVVADRATLRRPRGRDPRSINIRFRAIGQFRYVSLKTRKSVNISGARIAPGDATLPYANPKKEKRLVMEGLIVPRGDHNLRPLWKAFRDGQTWVRVGRKSKSRLQLNHRSYPGNATFTWWGPAIKFYIRQAGKPSGRIAGALIGHIQRHSEGTVERVETSLTE
jgi:hypothetical protein